MSLELLCKEISSLKASITKAEEKYDKQSKEFFKKYKNIKQRARNCNGKGKQENNEHLAVFTTEKSANQTKKQKNDDQNIAKKLDFNKAESPPKKKSKNTLTVYYMDDLKKAFF